MTLDQIRRICLSFPGATEDIKWGQDLCFSVGGKMFAAMNSEPPYSIGFKCGPETFAELTERDGIIPAPYLARAGWVQEEELGSAISAAEFEQLLRASYDLVVDRLPKSKRPGIAVANAGKARLGARAKSSISRRSIRKATRSRSRKRR